MPYDPGAAEWPGRKRRGVAHEETEDESVTARRTGCQEARPAFSPERLADALERCPSPSARHRDAEPHPCEPRRVAQIRDLRAVGDPVPPDVAREQLHRWQTALGQVAIPLGP